MKSKTNTIIGVVSDTHIPEESAELPQQLLCDFQSVDVIFHLGDFNDMATYHILENIAPVVGVYGNTDDAEIRNLLPQHKVIELYGKKIGLIHGWGPPPKMENRVLSKFKKIDMVLFGHSHVPLYTVVDGVQVFNPGSPFLNRQGAGTYGIVELGKTIQHRLIQIEE
jgi:putative phosphoesterase